MIYHRLYTLVIIRVLGIVINSLLLAFVWFKYEDFLIELNLGIILIVQVLLLIRKLNRLNRDLENFFKAVRNSDSSIRFQSKQGDDYSGLYDQFNLINKDIQKIKIENENQNQYFKVLVEHVAIGLISFDSKGNVLLFNREAKEIFNKTHLYRISDLDRIQDGLSKILFELEPSQQKLISLYRNSNGLIQLTVKAVRLKMIDQEVKLVSFQNIKHELDEKELDAWQKLIRVLTHEIMNSLSPINSSISTISDILIDGYKERPAKKIGQEEIHDVVAGLQIIEERTTGMVDFVSRFRDLTLLPKPNFKQVNLLERVENLLKLLKEKLTVENIEVNIVYPNEPITIEADSSMIDQVLINLITNSVQALENIENKFVEIKIGRNENGLAYLEIEDNGCGIEPENRSEVFTPFFTTKPKGSGVGLSLSRQLMRLHGGTIAFTSVTNGFTKFRLRFNS